jgi:hypothetical protein
MNLQNHVDKTNLPQTAALFFHPFHGHSAVLGGFVLLILIGVIIYLLVRKKK